MTDPYLNKENVPYLNARDRFNLPAIPKPEPKVDEIASQIARKKILVNDPRLMKLVIKYKRMKRNTEETDEFFKDSRFIKELKETFA